MIRQRRRIREDTEPNARLLRMETSAKRRLWSAQNGYGNRRYRGLAWKLTRKDIEFIAHRDDYIGLFAHWVVSGRALRMTPTFDRIDSTRGYEKDNVRIIPFYLNSSRSFAKLDEHKVREIRLQYTNGAKQRVLASRFGVGQDEISRIVNRKIWQHVN